MESPLLSALPLVLVLAAFVYAAVVGERVHGATGAISILGVAVTMFGLTLGWLLQRFAPTSRDVDDWIAFRSLRLEVTLLFTLVSTFSVVAVNLIRRDVTGKSRGDSAARKVAWLASLFLLAVIIPARAKLVAYVMLLLVRANP